MEKDPKIFEAMQEDAPIAVFRKTILGKVAVYMIDPFSGDPVTVLLEGNPKDKNNDNCYVKIYSAPHLLFFQRMNKRLIEIGHVIRDDDFVKEEPKQSVKPIEQYTDEELAELLNKPFAQLSKIISKVNNSIVIRRLLDKAVELEKSSKIVSTLETKLAELEGTVSE